MSEAAPYVIDVPEPHHKTRSPNASAALSDVAPFLIVGGLLLAFAGFTDLALFYLRPHFGEAAWEFGTIAQTFDAMPLPTLGLLLLALGVRARQSQRLTKLVAVAFALISLLCVVLLMLFLLDIPAALRTMRPPPTADAAQAAAIVSGLKLSAAKAILFAISYAAGCGALARLTWGKSRA